MDLAYLAQVRHDHSLAVMAHLDEIFRHALGWPEPCASLSQEWLDILSEKLKALPRGEVIATATLVDVLPVDLAELYSAKEARGNPGAIWSGSLTEKERAFGDYSERRFCWLLADVKLITPVPAKGLQRLWNWEPPC